MAKTAPPHPRSMGFAARKPAVVAAFAALLGFGGTSCSGESSPERMNLLFISVDTLRADHLSCYGYERPTSPVIDALAADGHRFKSAFTVMATTLPAHLSMFTSLFPAQTGVLANGFTVPEGVETLAERLKPAGYQTGGFVSAYPLNGQFQIQQGFDHYDFPTQASRTGADTFGAAIEWMQARDPKAPFFCFVHSFDPHTWYQVDEAKFADPFGAPRGRKFPPDRGFLTRPIPKGVQTATLNTYDAEIRYADAQVDRLLNYLDEEGLRDNTVIVFVSDHGESLDELAGRGYMFDHGEFLCRRELRIPLIFWLPRSYDERGPGVHDDVVNVLDIMPTVLDLLGLECAPPTAGQSLTGLMAGDELRPRMHFATRRILEQRDKKHLQGEEFSVIDGRWHWISSKARPNKLFDMSADPNEKRNLIAEHPERVETLKGALDDWKAAVAQQIWDSDGTVDSKTQSMLESLGYFDSSKKEEKK